MELPKPPSRLLLATAMGDLKLVKDALNSGESLTQVGTYGETPLDVAIQLGHKDIVNYLLASKAPLPSAEEIAAIPNKEIRDLVKRYADWKVESRGFAQFSTAVEHPSLARPGSPIEKLNRDVVGHIGSFLDPSGKIPFRRSKTAGRGRRKRKQTRRRK